MKSPGNRAATSGLKLAGLALVALVLLAAVVLIARQLATSGSVRQSVAATNAVTGANPSPPPPALPSANRPAANRASNQNYPDFQKRPLPVAIDGTNYQWVAADGKDPNVIRQLAHNELEYRRLVEENERINRRQLVYNQNPAAAVVQRARLSGERITQLTLPGFDGQELPFVVQRVDLEPSQQGGTFTGYLAGQPNSLVTLAFQFGREAFSVASPETGLYMQGHPREPGEIILTSFDPEKYLSLPGGEPIRTTNTFKIAQ